MDSGLSKKLVYPEYATYVSHKLSKAPAANDNPPAGTVYQWETVVNDVVYINVKFSNGTVKSYSLEPDGASAGDLTPSEIDDSIEFLPSDIVNDYLVIDRNYVISDISFYTDSTKTESQVVSLPILITENNTRVNFSEVDPSDYRFGGKVRLSRGVVYLYSEDTVYLMPSASGRQVFDTSLGYTFIVDGANIGSDLYISKENIRALPVNKLFKIVVDNTSNYDVYVEGDIVSYAKFFVCYMNLNGTVVQMGNAVEIN